MLLGSVVSKTTTYTATIYDDIVLCDGTSASFSVTLPTAVGNTGKILQFMKTDAALDKIITIDGNASETIRGQLTFKLCTQYDFIRIVSDGANWQVLAHTYPSVATTYTLATAQQGFGNIGTQQATWQRFGGSGLFQVRYTAGTVAGSEARNDLPTGLTIAAIVSAIRKFGDYGASSGLGATYFGQGSITGNGGNSFVNFGVAKDGVGGAAHGGNNGDQVCGSSGIVAWTAIIPITNWEG
jgi:hypothetical protein